ncbi:MAG TPA: LLM class flavin-dependent oxidoreductase [Candidatus Dormibacteraeota bacterium]|jgi:alkanesulfonate monooxygenase SsuD/methylene tetrahydromethanopterin reductase-like flavin-dependent oxidoreductase (luciferase family)|nr:LLM class flavin-dependent oxidoreductase [Candidatus Dormibacteraeota bacterium]
MKLGTSVRFLFPTSPATHERFRSLLASMPKGAFIERPMGAYAPDEQARNLMEVAAAARAAGLDALLTGDSHGANPAYAATFSPLPTVARLMSVTGDMPIGVVLLAPFYHPLLLAEQIGTLAAFAEGPLIVTFVLGGRPPQFQAFGMEERSRVGRLEEVVAIARALLAGERVTHRGRFYSLEAATISPLPRVPVEIWLGGTVAASAERAGRMGDAWLTGQNAVDEDLRQQLERYREAAVRAGRRPRPVLRRDIYVGESDQEARAVVGSILAEGYRGTGLDQLLVGSAEAVVEQLRRYRDMGFDSVMVRHIVGDHQLMLRSFERIGRDVMPRIRDL